MRLLRPRWLLAMAVSALVAVSVWVAPGLIRRMEVARGLEAAERLAARGDLDRARQSLRELMLRHPDEQKPRVALAKLYLRAGDSDGALSELEAALRGGGRAEHVRCAMAGILWELGQREHAAGLARIELQQDAKCSVARLIVGRHYLSIAQHGLAVQELEAAAKADPQSAPVQALLAGAYREASLPDRSLAAARRAVELAPGQVIPLVELALSLMESGQPGEVEEAVTVAERAQSLAPEAPFCLSALGQAYQRAGRHKEAVTVLRRAIEAGQSTRPELHFALSRAYAAQGRREEARQALREYETSKQLWKELSELEWSLETDARNTGRLHRLARVQERLDQLPQALSTYQRILSIRPQDAAARESSERLRRSRGTEQETKLSAAGERIR